MPLKLNKGQIRLIILFFLFVAGTAVIAVIFWPFIQNLQSEDYREGFTAWVTNLGIPGVLVLLGIQVLQIVVAVIPGGPVQIIAGAAYGATGGLAVLITGCVIASALIFFMVRKFGMPVLRKFFGEKEINAWMFLKDSRKVSRVVFILFLIPGTPKDLLTWLTPLTSLSLPAFVVISNLARIPAILSSTIMGDSMIKGNWILTIVMFLATALTGFLGMWFKDKISEKLNR